MLKDAQLVCDACRSVITRVTEVPDEGWPQLHNLCSKCYAELRQRALPR